MMCIVTGTFPENDLPKGRLFAPSACFAFRASKHVHYVARFSINYQPYEP